MRSLGAVVVVALVAGQAFADAPVEFLDEGKALMTVGACGKGDVPAKVKPEVVAAHCKKVTADQEDYKKSWISVAAPFSLTGTVNAAAHAAVFVHACVADSIRQLPPTGSLTSTVIGALL